MADYLFEDESRWTIMSSRFETDGLLKQMFDEMFEEWVESLPVDDPARLMYYMLPKKLDGEFAVQRHRPRRRTEQTMSAECLCSWVDEPEVGGSWLAAENPACPEHGQMISDGVWLEGKWHPRVQCQRRGTKSQLGREMT